MKEIKFRAWNSEIKEMVYFEDFRSICGCGIYDGMEFLQFTGLHDKNGKEIFEGDIVIHPSRNGGKPQPIVWDAEGGQWVGDYGLKWNLGHELNPYFEGLFIEVIGNIYEHSYLLENDDAKRD